MANWYQILQVSEEATEEEIKTAYRILAKKYHPDAHPGDKKCEEKFKEVSEAYRILSDPEKRRKVKQDLYRKKKEDVKQKGGVDFKQRADYGDIQDIYQNFERFFGFHPDTNKVVNEEKLKTKSNNPLDASDLFEAFMGRKR